MPFQKRRRKRGLGDFLNEMASHRGMCVASHREMCTCDNGVKVDTQERHRTPRSEGKSSFQSIPRHQMSWINSFPITDIGVYNPNGS